MPAKKTCNALKTSAIAPAVQAPLLARAILDQFQSFAQDRPLARCLLLLDPALRDAAHAPGFALALAQMHPDKNTQQYQRLMWLQPSLKTAQRPYMVPLDPRLEAGMRLLTRSLELALDDQKLESRAQEAGHRVCAWLFTDHAEQDLSTHLVRIAAQRLPFDHPRQSKQRVLLRYCDPQVMRVVWSISVSKQREALLGPIDQWLTLDCTGELQTYQAPHAHQTDAATPITLQFSSTQWQTLESIGALHHAIIQWQLKTRNDLPPPPEQIDATMQALTRAQRYGISGGRDLSTFAWHALTVHPRFDQHPRLQQIFRQLPAEDLYTTQTAEISELDWIQIQQQVAAFANRGP